MLTSQDYGAYTPEDHLTWRTLTDRQQKENYSSSATEYQRGFELLNIDPSRITDITRLSDRLEELSGWKLVPVTGLIPTRDFFFMLINKEYPVTVRVRKASEIDFSDEPDLFHDVYGHIPLLTHERFHSFLSEFSNIALKYVDNDEAVEHLGRLFWFTFEMGIIMENGEPRPYGGAMLTSRSEIDNAKSTRTIKHPFSIRKVLRTPYDHARLQTEYFVIESFDDLFDSLKTLEEDLRDALGLNAGDLQLSTEKQQLSGS